MSNVVDRKIVSPGDVLTREGITGLCLTDKLQSGAVGVWSGGDMVQWQHGSFTVSKAAKWNDRAPMPRGTRLKRKAIPGEIRGYFGLEKGSLIHDLGQYTLVVNDSGRTALWPIELVEFMAGPPVGPQVKASYRNGPVLAELDLAPWLSAKQPLAAHYSLITAALGSSSKLTANALIKEIFSFNEAAMPSDGILTVNVRDLSAWISAMEPTYLPDLDLPPEDNSPRVEPESK